MRPIDAGMKQKMLLVWAVSLVACIIPHPLLGDRWQQLFHQPLFLLVVPVVVACIPLILPVRAPRSDDEQEEWMRRKREGNGWTALLMLRCMLAAFFGWCLVDAWRDTFPPQAERIKVCLELAGAMLLPLCGIWTALRKLKQIGHLWY